MALFVNLFMTMRCGGGFSSTRLRHPVSQLDESYTDNVCDAAFSDRPRKRPAKRVRRQPGLVMVDEAAVQREHAWHRARDKSLSLLQIQQLRQATNPSPDGLRSARWPLSRRERPEMPNLRPRPAICFIRSAAGLVSNGATIAAPPPNCTTREFEQCTDLPASAFPTMP